MRAAGGLILCMAVCGCRKDPANDTAGGGDGPALNCLQPTGESSAPEVYPASDVRYRVVELPSETFESLYAMVIYPSDGQTLWEQGAPIVVTAPPSMVVNAKWEDNPSTYFPGDMGVIEVQPVWPGWSVQGHSTTGPADNAGPRAAMALAEVIRFAAGDLDAVGGFEMVDLVKQPVCTGQVAVLGISNGSIPAVYALTEHWETLDGLVLGLSLYESASLPEFVTLDSGAIWLDPTTVSDGDGNGVDWDDGRNLSFDPDACTVDGCEHDLTTLSWDPQTNLEEVWTGDVGENIEDGLLYLDRDGDGRLSAAANGLDVDGSGAIEVDEDMYLFPHVDTDTSSVQRHYYSPMVTAAAVSSDLFGGSWPDIVADSEDNEVFWAERNAASALVAGGPMWAETLAVGLVYTQMPHAVSVQSRPNMRLMYDLLRDGGMSVRFNTRAEVCECLLGSSACPVVPVEPNQDIDAADMADHAMAEAYSTSWTRAAGALDLFWDRQPFDRCPASAPLAGEG